MITVIVIKFLSFASPYISTILKVLVLSVMSQLTFLRDASNSNNNPLCTLILFEEFFEIAQQFIQKRQARSFVRSASSLQQQQMQHNNNHNNSINNNQNIAYLISNSSNGSLGNYPSPALLL